MSGTSADGIDCAICEISSFPPLLQWSVREFFTIPWQDDVRQQILDLYIPGRSGSDRICVMNSAIAEALSEAVRQAAERHRIDLVASHGQTIWHQPEDVQVGKFQIRSTLQIGDLSRIAERTGITTVGNFRMRDMAAGGQGAPLVPYTDWLMFTDDNEDRILLNIGGIANATRLHSNCQPEAVTAFDTGPGNALIDLAVADVTGGRLRYDVDGKIAGSGKVDEVFVEDLLKHSYFAETPPKSTGRELFSERFYQDIKSRFTGGSDDLIATLTAFTAASIADAFEKWMMPGLRKAPVVYVGGGGVKNQTLMGMLADRTGLKVDSIEQLGLDPEAKEAVCFAILGYLSLHGYPGSLPSVTGAGKASILGEIAPGNDYIQLMKQVVGRL